MVRASISPRSVVGTGPAGPNAPAYIGEVVDDSLSRWLLRYDMYAVACDLSSTRSASRYSRGSSPIGYDWNWLIISSSMAKTSRSRRATDGGRLTAPHCGKRAPRHSTLSQPALWSATLRPMVAGNIPRLVEVLRTRAGAEKRLPCAEAFKVARDLEIPVGEVGKACNDCLLY